jgi:hypothetical protein
LVKNKYLDSETKKLMNLTFEYALFALFFFFWENIGFLFFIIEGNGCGSV